MDKRILALIAAAVIVSGCTSLIETNDSPEGIEPDPGKGLELTEVSVADNQLRAGDGNLGQRTEIQLVLSNHHEIDVDPQIELANTGYLENVSDTTTDEACNKENLNAVREETVDQMRCTWEVYAPNRSRLGQFDQKQEYVSVIVSYDSQVTNREPLTFSFMDRDDIESSDQVTRKFSNNEVTLTITADNPAALDSSFNQFELDIRNSGPGSVESEKYDFSYTPRSIFEDDDGDLICPSDGRRRNTEDDEFSDECAFNVDSESQRNVFVAASYKYQKQQTLPITIVR